MTTRPTHRIATGSALLLGTAAAAPAALAGGEPKNEPPFVRPVLAQTLNHQVSIARLHAGLLVAGEPKNQAPFTRR
jgi:hypothetical protein